MNWERGEGSRELNVIFKAYNRNRELEVKRAKIEGRIHMGSLR